MSSTDGPQMANSTPLLDRALREEKKHRTWRGFDFDLDYTQHALIRDGMRSEVPMKRVNRFAEYEGWKIEASPTILANQRLFVSGVIVSRDNERFIFTDLGNRVYRAQAYERGIEWARQWIDNNYRLAVRKASRG
ncbi:hypothetical protein [Paraburkholderia sp. SARCC-3016]|uniref:hypothetical protein n=1 Tax=Paraburkholderia sp. SARCC-3016 TaxID=3058611 RepID=UPI00280B9771|nr:hypothetical protein [Paraburkholderia sp. SARCC-3016]